MAIMFLKTPVRRNLTLHLIAREHICPFLTFLTVAKSR
jgi:hypothetical protein